MNRTLDYILGNLNYCEDSIRKMNRVLNTQFKFNRRVGILAVITVTNLFLIKYSVVEHKKQIEELKKEIDELKNIKGEYEMK